MAKAWSLDPALFADKVEEDVGKLQRVIAIQLLNEIVIRSPVGNPEIWAINSSVIGLMISMKPSGAVTGSGLLTKTVTVGLNEAIKSVSPVLSTAVIRGNSAPSACAS